MDIAVVGLNHKTANVAVREKVAFTAQRVERALAALSNLYCVEECLILSTCNRTELYCVFKEGCFDTDALRFFVADYNNIGKDDITPYLYQLGNKEVVEHLFKVVSGLDSMVMGENQIMAQTRQAYRYATTGKTTGPILNKLIHFAFRVGKKIRTQTGIGLGSMSIGQVACDFARKIHEDFRKASLLLIGAGENGELTARIFKDRGIGKLFIANRTISRAKALAEKTGAEVVRMEKIENALLDVDILLCSTGASGFLLSKETVERVALQRKKPLFIIDLAVPRDIEPAVGDLENVFLYDLDALIGQVEANKESRKEQAHVARNIIGDEIEKFMEWHKKHKAAPTIKQMQEYVEAIRLGELEKIKDKLSEKNRLLFDSASKTMVNKILHTPISSIKKAAGKSDNDETIKTIRTILGLPGEG